MKNFLNMDARDRDLLLRSAPGELLGVIVDLNKNRYHNMLNAVVLADLVKELQQHPGSVDPKNMRSC